MSQNYLLTCKCGKKISVGSGQAGGKTKCACGQTVEIPELRELRKLPKADASKAEASGKDSDKDAVNMTPLRVFFSVSVLMAIVALLIAGNLGYQRSKLDIGIPDEQVRVMEADAMDKLTAAQAYDVWREFRLKGLRSMGGSPWHDAQREFAEITQMIQRSLFVAGLGILSAALSAVLTRGRTKRT